MVYISNTLGVISHCFCSYDYLKIRTAKTTMTLGQNVLVLIKEKRVSGHGNDFVT